VKTGLVTHSVRDTKMGEVEITEGDCIGIADGTIVVAQPELLECAKSLLAAMVEAETGLVTIIYGEGIAEEEAEDIEKMLAADYPDVEVEILSGGQP
ncbi:hypothetical protein MXD81_18290, partial [Microbacteriaceae bacterium K1510]|nr:hypothetical protein [Microbacteriaceae bacterium K1510]